jgi:hypothetical protein
MGTHRCSAARNLCANSEMTSSVTGMKSALSQSTMMPLDDAHRIRRTLIHPPRVEGLFCELPLYGVPRSSARPWLWGPRNESPLFETPLCMRDCFWATRVRGTIVPHPAKESILRDGRSGRRNRRRDHPPGTDETARPGSQVPPIERKGGPRTRSGADHTGQPLCRL